MFSKLFRHLSGVPKGQLGLGGTTNNNFNLNPILTCSASPLMLEQQRRGMSRVKRRFTHPMYFWPKKKRERHDQELTIENQEFVNQVILDKFGPVAIPETGAPYVSPLKDLSRTQAEWRPGLLRPGLIGRKVGVYPMWKKDGTRILTTLIQIVDNHVIKYLPPEVCLQNYPDKKWKGRGLLICGSESADPQLFTKEYCGLFNEAGVLPKLKLARFIVNPEAELQPGTPLYVNHFRVGQYVDIQGKTIDYQFQGVMKRWGMKGGPKTHGVTKSHRRPGCIGSGGERAMVLPGQKMPGHMGAAMRFIRGQRIVRINKKYNVIYVKGPAIQGETGSFLVLRDTFIPTKFYGKENAPPFPTYFPSTTSVDDDEETEDVYDEDLFDFAQNSIIFDEEPLKAKS